MRVCFYCRLCPTRRDKCIFCYRRIFVRTEKCCVLLVREITKIKVCHKCPFKMNRCVAACRHYNNIIYYAAPTISRNTAYTSAFYIYTVKYLSERIQLLLFRKYFSGILNILYITIEYYFIEYTYFFLICFYFHYCSAVLCRFCKAHLGIIRIRCPWIYNIRIVTPDQRFSIFSYSEYHDLSMFLVNNKHNIVNIHI